MTYTVHAGNNQQRIPSNVTHVHVVISDDINHSFYKEILKAHDEDNYKIHLTIYNSNTEIPNDAFYKCDLIKSIIIPHRVSKIGVDAFNIAINEITAVSDDNPFLNSVDKMNMTALHVLSCNPNASLDMIRELASK